MAENRDLHVLGAGVRKNLENARRLSEIWSIWRPDLFADINISFQQIEEKANCFSFNGTRRNRSIMFYSGGIDSTYTLLSRLSQGKSQDLLTIHGMDYKLDDHKRFRAAERKTEQLTESSCENRFFVRSNGYNIYSKYGMPSEAAFVFLLATAGFAYYRSHQNCVLAADNSLEEQFLAFPDYGSNSASNQYGDS